MRRLFLYLSPVAEIASGSETRSESGAGTFQRWMRSHRPGASAPGRRPRGSHDHWLKLKSLLAVRALRGLPAAGRLRRRPDVLPAPDRRPRDGSRFPDPFGRDRSRSPVAGCDAGAHKLDGDAQSALLTAWATARPSPPFQPWSEAGAAHVRHAIDLPPPWLVARPGADEVGRQRARPLSARRPVWARLRAASRARSRPPESPLCATTSTVSADLRERCRPTAISPPTIRTRSTSCT